VAILTVASVLSESITSTWSAHKTDFMASAIFLSSLKAIITAEIRTLWIFAEFS
jgi:hypothetical protein